MITNYTINSDTSIATCTYNDREFSIPPRWNSGEMIPVDEDGCLEVIQGILESEAEVTLYINNEYIRDRVEAYPSLEEQADMAYWDRKNGTTILDDALDAVKAAHPKPTGSTK